MQNKNKFGALPRLMRTLFEFYPLLLPATLVCIVINAVSISIPAIFMQNIVAIVEANWETSQWSQVVGQILFYVGLLGGIYAVSLVAAFAYNRMMAIITQGTLSKLRIKCSTGCRTCPSNTLTPTITATS